MNRKITKRINGGFSIYYGVSALMVGIGALVVAVVVVVKMALGFSDYTWYTPAGIFIIGVVMTAIGYAIVRAGYEEIEK